MSPLAARERPMPIQAAVLAALLALGALAWLWTHERMLGMDAGPGTNPGSVGFYVVSWVVMMGAMMFPSIAPMVLTFTFVQRRRRERGTIDGAVSPSIFVAGYLLTWTVFGLAAYGLYVGVRSLSIPALSWHRGGSYLAGGVLLTAAAYQLTPAKDACLRRCRTPLDFVLGHWREGPLGALRMGAIHGAWCVGCCWGLMAALFALGVMSLSWMIVIALMIAVEKLLPRRHLANLLVASTLAALGLGLTFAPASVPGLTVPGSPAAMRAMQTMRGMGTKHSMGGMAGMGGGHPMGAMPAMGAKHPMGAKLGMGSKPGKGSNPGKGSKPSMGATHGMRNSPGMGGKAAMGATHGMSDQSGMSGNPGAGSMTR